jgi:cell division protein FtsI (penicillin-binding protein 3)
VIYSSNIGIVQIAQKLPAHDYHDGLVKFGFTRHTVDGLSDENGGFIPDSKRLGYEIYKAITSYGYGVKVNLLQLLQAYNVFNNDGIFIKPRIVADSRAEKPKKVMDAKTANAMKKILIETVEKGTGKNAKMQGLEIGGKTGTAHVVKSWRYIKEYNCSFVGFVNKDKKSYTIAVLVQEPQTSQYASETAVVVFKGVVDILVQKSY